MLEAPSQVVGGFVVQGIRILDLSRVLAGPWATQQLADQGAEVIKVEPPGGDETRRFGPLVDGVSTYYLAINRNKRSIVLDLRTEAGREVVERLVASCDVLVENFRPGVAERLGVGFETLRERHPRLVYVAIHAFGDGRDGDADDDRDDGGAGNDRRGAARAAWARRAGYDLVLQAMGGAVSFTGFPGSPPVRAGTPVADLNAAQLAVQGVLLGLLQRERTGRGQKIVVNMMQAQTAALTYLATRWTLAGEQEVQRGNQHRGLVPYDLYRCRDGWIAVACGNDGIWQRLRAALGIPDREAWRTNLQRVDAREAVDAAVGEALGRLSVAEADRVLSEAGVPAGPVLDTVGAVSHPAVQTVTVDHPELGPIRLPGASITSATTRREHRAPPALGADRDAILHELGYDADGVARLGARGAFGPSTG